MYFDKLSIDTHTSPPTVWQSGVCVVVYPFKQYSLSPSAWHSAATLLRIKVRTRRARKDSMMQPITRVFCGVRSRERGDITFYAEE
jgi:hypothetical protein